MAEGKPRAKPKLSSRLYLGRGFGSKGAAKGAKGDEASDPGANTAEVETAEVKGSEAKTTEIEAPQGKAGGATAEVPEQTAEGSKPNLEERIEGIQGWMAEIERRQRRIVRLGGAAAILAILAAGGALALGIINQRDAATKDDVDEIKEALAGTQSAVKEATEKQLKSLNDTVASLDQRVQALSQQQAQSATTIATLQTQLNAVKAQVNAAAQAPNPAPQAKAAPPIGAGQARP
jgi:uncharacterized protein HemX